MYPHGVNTLTIRPAESSDWKTQRITGVSRLYVPSLLIHYYVHFWTVDFFLEADFVSIVAKIASNVLFESTL